MTSIAYSPVSIQTSAQSVPSTPDWFGEVTLISRYLHRQGVLTAIEEQVRFARRRFGRYEVIDFVAVLFGYAVSGERRQAVKKYGSSSANGSGTSGWSWVISFILIRCGRPSLHLLSRPRAHRNRRPTRRLPHRDMDQRRWLCPGRLVASRGKTLPFNQMARYAVQLASRLWQTSGAERPMGVCVWCMRPASAVVVLAPCVSSVNGMAAPPP